MGWTWQSNGSRILSFRADVPGWVRGVVGKSREALAMMAELEPDYRE